MRQRSFSASLMRGGTSKGLVVDAAQLPEDTVERDRILVAAMGSPDPRQIDGVGGAHPLTSKVALVSRSARDDADVEYLFLQIRPDRAEVSDQQNCGNMLAAVGPFAIESGFVTADGDEALVRIWMRNTRSLAVAHVQLENGRVRYDGDAAIDGVPGTAAPIAVDFLDVAGSTCGALLPTGHPMDEINGIRVTCIDNGMPVVCIAAADLGLTGSESPFELEADDAVTKQVEAIRLTAGPMMNLGDVGDATTPKVSLLAPPADGGAVSTRTFIPHRVHDAIGVFGAVSVATACLVPGSVARAVADVSDVSGPAEVVVEHPSGSFTVALEVDTRGGAVTVRRSALLRTARLLMRGEVFVPGGTR